MGNDTAISGELIRAYRATDYRVLEPPAFTLRIGEASRELAALYRRTNTATASVMTAWNPYSEPTSVGKNEAAQARLIADLDEARIIHLKADGADPKGGWAEPSLLALGLSLETARSLGIAYRQNCIVWVSADAIPRLELLR